MILKTSTRCNSREGPGDNADTGSISLNDLYSIAYSV